MIIFAAASINFAQLLTMNKEILRIALPSIITNITVPLLGIVDVAITGHIGNSTMAIGAIAVGGLVFNMVYWLFNFLRMGSSGLTAQAFGRGDRAGQKRVLRMGLTVAIACGLAIFCLQRPLEWFAHWVISPSDEVWTLAVEYFRVRVWAAPAVLALFALNGWFVGMQNSRFPLYIAVGQNLINIAISYLLVFHFDMGVRGVALGTVAAQYAGLLVAWKLSTYLSTKIIDNSSTGTYERGSVDNYGKKGESYQQLDVDNCGKVEWKTFFTVNRDIFFRMICLISVTTAFTSYGSHLGDTLLAVNTLLMQLFILFSYFSDGFALAGEALVGKYYGICCNEELGMRNEDLSVSNQLQQKHSSMINSVVRRLFIWGSGVMMLFTLIYTLGGLPFLRLLSDEEAVIQAATPYLGWAIAVPACGIAAFMWDGVFIGLTATRQMFYSLLTGALLFFGLYEGGTLLLEQTQQGPENVSPALQNHLLWLSFIVYLVMRGVYLTLAWKHIRSTSSYSSSPDKA